VKEDLGAHRQKGSNHRALHYRRIPVFLTELRISRCYFTTKLAFEWLVLTATRTVRPGSRRRPALRYDIHEGPAGHGTRGRSYPPRNEKRF
jgi:hypothetical protein